MFNQYLIVVYCLLLKRGENRVPWIERFLKFDNAYQTSIDDARNEPNIFEQIFSTESVVEFEHIYKLLLREIDGVPYSKCGDQFEAFKFIQLVSSKAIYQYRINIGSLLEKFVIEFDRLDVNDDCNRLYESAQSRSSA